MENKFNFWIFGVSFILLGISISLNIGSLVVTNESIVLVFVGILATFIVVGNYAQVSEIRNDSERKIRELESQTNKKIDELNVLFENNKSITKEIKKIEKNTYFISGESYRLYALYTLDRNHYKIGTAHLINAISNYVKSGKEDKFINTILDIIIDNLKAENWNHVDSTEKIDYDELITLVRELPEKYNEKKDILKKLEDYKGVY